MQMKTVQPIWHSATLTKPCEVSKPKGRFYTSPPNEEEERKKKKKRKKEKKGCKNKQIKLRIPGTQRNSRITVDRLARLLFENRMSEVHQLWPPREFQSQFLATELGKATEGRRHSPVGWVKQEGEREREWSREGCLCWSTWPSRSPPPLCKNLPPPTPTTSPSPPPFSSQTAQLVPDFPCYLCAPVPELSSQVLEEKHGLLTFFCSASPSLTGAVNLL